MIDSQQLSKRFADFFNTEPRLFRAPGRVNLIGEHTDYNGGFVLPMAIDRETCIAVSLRNDRKIRAFSVNLDEVAEFDLDVNFSFKKGVWLNYIEGIARLLEEKGFKLSGANILIWSDVPSGAGLSSSAALETVCAFALSKIHDYEVDKTLIAQIGQETEHNFVGVKVGIMDQFVSANAKKDHALLLDCRSLEFENVSLNLKNHAFVICNTNIKHDLASSEYNTRRNECEQAVEILQTHLPEIKSLRDAKLTDLETFKNDFSEIIFKRARHIISENTRTIEAAKSLKFTNLAHFGELMFASHLSLKNDFEVSCKELDILVEIARNCKGVLGARMTGGGFGGSTVNLVEIDQVDKFKAEIEQRYFEQTNIQPTILMVESANGASEILI